MPQHPRHRARRFGTISAVVPTLENSIFAKGIQSSQSRLASKGIALLLASSNHDLDHEVDEIRELVSHGVDEEVEKTDMNEDFRDQR